jgi:hypothetical protein
MVSSIRLINSAISKLNETAKDAGEFGLKESFTPLNLTPIPLHLRRWVLVTFFSLGIALLGLYWEASGRQPHKTTWNYETGGIEFTKYLGDGVWLAEFPGQDPKRVKPCGDPIVLKVGVVLKRWEYYWTGHCMYVGPDCEVNYLTDKEGRVVDLQGRRIFDIKEN